MVSLPIFFMTDDDAYDLDRELRRPLPIVRGYADDGPDWPSIYPNNGDDEHNQKQRETE